MKTLSQQIADIRGLIHVASRLPYEQKSAKLQEAADKMLRVMSDYEDRSGQFLQALLLVLDLLLENFMDLESDILYIRDYSVYKWTIKQLEIFRNKLREDLGNGTG